MAVLSVGANSAGKPRTLGEVGLIIRSVPPNTGLPAAGVELVEVEEVGVVVVVDEVTT